MRIAVTGTPGTGKTTATQYFKSDKSAQESGCKGRSDGESRRQIRGGDRPSSSNGDYQTKTTRNGSSDTFEVVHLNDVVETNELYTHVDHDRGSYVADLDALSSWLDRHVDGPAVIESHLSHRLDVDRVVVLRCHPSELESRLEERGESTRKINENAESEALDVILAEAVDIHGPESVYELDTTALSPIDVATELEAIIHGERSPEVGVVDFLEYLE